MKKKSSARTVGIDLRDRKHSVCVLDAKGVILKQESITNSRGSLTALSRHPGALMVMEVGMRSPWWVDLAWTLDHACMRFGSNSHGLWIEPALTSDRSHTHLNRTRAHLGLWLHALWTEPAHTPGAIHTDFGSDRQTP